jgi:ubiquinone/menaquinone biosynthesis C-methylase UbiE
VLQLSDIKDQVLSHLAHKTDGLHFLIQGKNEILDISDSMISVANQETSKSNIPLQELIQIQIQILSKEIRKYKFE